MLEARLYTTILLLMIAGCAGPMVPARSGAPASTSVTAFNGSYRTTIRVTGTSAAAQGTNWCDTQGQPVVTVANGQFTYAVPHPNVPGSMTPTFMATMAQDGSFSGQSVDGTIAGQVSGAQMTGTINGQGCIYGFSGNRT
jgi:hypothetical protein